MRGVGWVLLLAIVLSGCSGGGGNKDGEHAEHGDGPGQAAGPGNVTAVIAIVVNGTPVQAVNGSMPVVAGVNLTFDASNSTGNATRYDWDLGDGTKVSGASVRHAYNRTGTLTVKLTAVARSSFDEASVTLNVSSGGPAPGQLLHTQREAFSGSLALGNPNSPTQAGTDYRDHLVTLLDTTPNGTAIARVARIVLDGSGTGAAFSLYWRDPSGANLATALASFPPAAGDADKAILYEGDMPAGDYTIRVRLNAGVQASYGVTAEFDYLT